MNDAMQYMTLRAESLAPLLGYYAIRLVAAAAIFFIGKWVAKKIVNVLRRSFVKSRIDATLAGFICNILYFVLLAFIVIAALGQLGIETATFAAAVAAAGLAVGLALQGSLSNFASGVLIIVFRPFKVGDWIECGSISGEVRDISIFTATLHSVDKKTIIVPNAKLTSDAVINYTMEPHRRVELKFGVAYTEDVALARKAILDVLAKDKRVLSEPAPVVLLAELGASSVNLSVRLWVNNADYWGVFFDNMEAIKNAFDKEGITIPFTQTDVHFIRPPTKVAVKSAPESTEKTAPL
ncbi:MAG: mechanosensitive ion channel domain-containing protein [Rickettsiales bacterium]